MEREAHELFAMLLLGLATRFINLPLSSIDDAIEDIQHKILTYLDIVFSLPWHWKEHDRNILTITHLAGPPERSLKPFDIDASIAFPCQLKRLPNGELLASSNGHLPKEAQLDREFRKLYGVESSVCIPLMTGDTPLFGVLTFHVMRKTLNDTWLKLPKKNNSTPA